MQIKKWSATIAAVAVIFSGGLAADQHKAKAAGKPAAEKIEKMQKSGDARSRDEIKEREREREMEMVGTQGAQTSQEMQERREARKEIQAEYREGQATGDVEEPKKKPWWKFWDSETES